MSMPSFSHWIPVSYTHLRAHETPEHLVCRLLLEKKTSRWANVRITRPCVRVPSAIVRERSAADLATIRPSARDSQASAASSCSTPMTRAAGRRAFTATATPLARPPPVSYTHLRAHETPEHLVCRLLLASPRDS